jgi:thymidylate synthase ThyX
MAYSAKILADSISKGTPYADGVRLTTFEITYPRFVHSELMTHRVFSRNSASSRAIPVEKMLKRIEEDPVIPVWWGKNQSGMQAREELPSDKEGTSRNTLLPQMTKEWAQHEWLLARDESLDVAKTLYLKGKGLHKQIANRVVEPWMWITVIVTATEWDNFFALRCHEDAQPEIRKIAEMMKEIYDESYNRYESRDKVFSNPNHMTRLVEEGEWHLPLWNPESLDRDLIKNEWGEVLVEDPNGYLLPRKVYVSAGRCARVSYLTHDGKRDPQADLDLARSLAESGHWSPWEHIATPFTEKQRFGIKLLENTITTSGIWSDVDSHCVNETFRNLHFSGNFRGWHQARKFFYNESGTE